MTIHSRKRGWLLAGAAGLILLVGVMAWVWRPAPASWRTAVVDRGEVSQRIQATGTLNALIEVSVGTQVSGVVTALYADFNSLVKKGQLLARIDPSLMETQLADARAAADGALGTYENAEAELGRYRALAAQQLVSASDLEVKETAFRTARASLESARATLEKARMNLGYCTITAPVDGVVVSRVVDVGQTVAASLSTPSLFTVAQDLSRMKLEAAIDEADIGQVRVGQQASFTVDSYPDRTFQAKVSEIQLNPTISSNVVTYNVVFAVANVNRPDTGETPPVQSGEVESTALYVPKGSLVYQGDLALFPGMTANVTLVVDHRPDVLRVPNAALRFSPVQGGSSEGSGETALGRVWVLENGHPRPLKVRTGLSDDQRTEISGEGIREGLVVLTGTTEAKKAATATSLMGGPAGAPPPR